VTEPSIEACRFHLVARGLALTPENLTIEPLGDQSPGAVLAASGTGLDVVVKHAAGEPGAGHLDAEARALRLVRTLVPGTVPPVLDLDSGYLVLARAHRDWTNWLADLSAGTVDVEVARRLGWILGRLQRRTAADPEAISAFADRTGFERLRVDPLHHAVRDRHPDLVEAVEITIATMAATDQCLVHGAFAPKNVLVSPAPGPEISLGVRRVWVLDWEAVHRGDPTFDPAVLLAHLLLASAHRPADAARHAASAGQFVPAMIAERADLPPMDRAQLGRQVGVQLVAAVDGKSPLAHLNRDVQERVRELGRSLLLDPPEAITAAWKRLE
jgi:hypothetical protein